VSRFFYYYAECPYAERHYAEFLSAIKNPHSKVHSHVQQMCTNFDFGCNFEFEFLHEKPLDIMEQRSLKM
jgi:hypothetical protein